MVDTLPRPQITAQRYRELEMSSWQVMLMAHASCGENLDEMLVMRDICTRILERWMADERLAQHEIAARSGVALLAERDGNIIHLRPASQE